MNRIIIRIKPYSPQPSCIAMRTSEHLTIAFRSKPTNTSEKFILFSSEFFVEFPARRHSPVIETSEHEVEMKETIPLLWTQLQAKFYRLFYFPCRLFACEDKFDVSILNLAIIKLNNWFDLRIIWIIDFCIEYNLTFDWIKTANKKSLSS